MFTLYTSATPNGWKVSIALEELELPYEVVALNLAAGDQRTPEYTALNPNARIPTLVHHLPEAEGGDFVIFESGAILVYLAELTGKLMPADVRGRSQVMQWLMFQMGGVGPMMGQANVFYRYAEQKIPYAIDRYHREGRRLMEVLDRQLEGREFLCGDYSIADIANWSWAHTTRWSGIDVDGLENLGRWRRALRERPAVKRGRDVPVPRAAATEASSRSFANNARKLLV